MKIAVIGGGPAGLCAAIEAVSHNCIVNLYEKRKIGEGICCAEGIFNSMNILKKTEKTSGFLYEVESVICQINNKLITLPNPNIWMMDRASWQQSLADRAAHAGVNVYENTNIDKDKLVKIKQEHDWVIDASGAPSITGFAYNFHTEYIDNCIIAYQYNINGDFSELYSNKSIKIVFPAEIPKTYFPYYFWIFPKSASNANIGFAYFKQINGVQIKAKTLLDKFIVEQQLDKNNIVSEGGSIIPSQKPSFIKIDNIILIGDAMGAVSPLHGGGIDTACISGALAVKMLCKEEIRDFEKVFFGLLKNKLLFEKQVVAMVQKKGVDGISEAWDIISNVRKGKKYFAAAKLIYSSWTTIKALKNWRNDFINNNTNFKIDI